MADGLKKAAVWLGLMSDNRYAGDEVSQEITQVVDPSGPPERGVVVRERTPRVEASVTELETRRPGTALAAVPVPERETPNAMDINRIVTVQPRTYNEARTIGEHFRDGVPVIMNLSGMEDADAKRLVDFAAGLIFGLRGSIERVTSKVFLLSPHNVSVTAEDKQRLAGGFFNQS
nr:cell division protein SepF [Propionibacterium sp.]